MASPCSDRHTNAACSGPIRFAIGAACLMMVACGSVASAQQIAPQLFRVFLRDGTPLISYGEYTRAGSRIVFTVPLGGGSSSSAFQIVSLPDTVVDWARTTAYSDMLRFRHYAATRGDADYTALTADVARALGDIAFERDARRKLAIAQRVRATLHDWPRTHYGFRSAEVRDLTAVIDEAISGIQADLGQRHFEIELVALLEPPAGQPLPDPTLHDTIEAAYVVARHSDQPAERLALQQAILAVLTPDVPDIPAERRVALRSAIRADVRRLRRETHDYSDLTFRAEKTAAHMSAAGHVAGIEALLRDVRQRDAELGRRRPDEMAALNATLNVHLDAARVRRLELDRWRYRHAAFAAYKTDVDGIMRRLSALGPAIEAVRAMSGPEPAQWPRLERRFTDVRGRLALTVPPDDLREAHETMAAAVSLMEEALRQRRDAVLRADTQVAHNASAAAAGAALLLDHARSAVSAYFHKPGRP